MRPKLKLFVSPDPTYPKIFPYPNNFITIFSSLIFLVWVVKLNPLQTDVKVYRFSGARGKDYCATIYQTTP